MGHPDLTFTACKIKDGKKVENYLIVFNLLKITNSFQVKKHLVKLSETSISTHKNLQMNVTVKIAELWFAMVDQYPG